MWLKFDESIMRHGDETQVKDGDSPEKETKPFKAAEFSLPLLR